jgi:hypothetical protein
MSQFGSTSLLARHGPLILKEVPAVYKYLYVDPEVLRFMLLLFHNIYFET